MANDLCAFDEAADGGILETLLNKYRDDTESLNDDSGIISKASKNGLPDLERQIIGMIDNVPEDQRVAMAIRAQEVIPDTSDLYGELNLYTGTQDTAILAKADEGLTHFLTESSHVAPPVVLAHLIENIACFVEQNEIPHEDFVSALQQVMENEGTENAVIEVSPNGAIEQIQQLDT